MNPWVNQKLWMNLDPGEAKQKLFKMWVKIIDVEEDNTHYIPWIKEWYFGKYA